MEYKAVLFDFDGVISPGRYFSEIYAETFDVDINKVIPFFKEMEDLFLLS